MPHKPFKFIDRIRSFQYAINGFWTMLKSQHNAWIHALATGLVFIAAGFLGLSKIEWCLIVLAIMVVWMAEAFNTALEFLADAYSPDHHPLIGKAKDVAASAVLITAIGAGTVGVLIFLPKILALFQ